MYSDIFKLISTTEQAEMLQEHITAYIAMLYQNMGKTPYELIEEAFPEELVENLTMMLQKTVPNATIEGAKSFFTGVSEALDKAILLRVTIAVDPNEEIIRPIADWMHEMFPGQSMLLEITLDKAILGGLIVVYEGKYIDLSLKKQIDQLFEQKRDYLVSLLG